MTAIESVSVQEHPASFRDPSGVVFRGSDGTLLRQVNPVYASDYRQLMDGGLYARLVADGLLIEHDELDSHRELDDQAYCVLRPRELPFISYPYEWSFSALQEAALLTLRIQRTAMEFGMSLKDASSFNVQFDGVSPIFIDTLSFEAYEVDRPWDAYGQFCRHFLAPLALMAYVKPELNRLLSVYIDGVPLDVASKMLPMKTRFQFGLLMHLHMQAKFVAAYSETEIEGGEKVKDRKLSRQGLISLLENLEKCVSRMSLRVGGTEWGDYYESNSYDSAGFEQKQTIVREFLERIQPETVWDLGANTGVFSRLAAEIGATVYGFDVDPACVEMGFRHCRREKIKKVMPLYLDLTNPTPAVGWAHQERLSLAERGPADVVMALALIHHLSISNNLPFQRVARYFRELGRQLIIEFVPKTDPQVKRLLRSRKDIFESYDQETFEAAFSEQFAIVDRHAVGSDGRVLYLMTATPPIT